MVMNRWLTHLPYKAYLFRAKVQYHLWMMQCKVCKDCLEILEKGETCSCGKVTNP
jgi:hypothetical protein